MNPILESALQKIREADVDADGNLWVDFDNEECDALTQMLDRFVGENEFPGVEYGRG